MPEERRHGAAKGARQGVRQRHGRRPEPGRLRQLTKENERRLPLHPRHLPRVPADLQRRIFLEEGYGERFGLADEKLQVHVAGFMSRDQLVAECDVILNPKPVLDDIERLRNGQVFWGWPHCVQDEQLTQVAVDKALTLVAFEAMNRRPPACRRSAGS